MSKKDTKNPPSPDTYVADHRCVEIPCLKHTWNCILSGRISQAAKERQGTEGLLTESFFVVKSLLI